MKKYSTFVVIPSRQLLQQIALLMFGIFFFQNIFGPIHILEIDKDWDAIEYSDIPESDQEKESEIQKDKFEEDEFLSHFDHYDSILTTSRSILPHDFAAFAHQYASDILKPPPQI